MHLGDGGKEKLIPLIQGPSDTRDLHSSKWLNESRKPESLLAPDLLAFTIQIPQHMDYSYSSGECKVLEKVIFCYSIYNAIFKTMMNIVLDHLEYFDDSTIVYIENSHLKLRNWHSISNY